MVTAPVWYPRHSQELAEDILAHAPVLVIQGARQVGKSSLGARLIQGRGRAVTLDEPEQRLAADADVTAFVSQAPDRTLLIDEVQLRPEVLLAVKASVDRDRRPGRFILTGAANLLRLRGEPAALAGRALDLPLQPLSQGELRHRKDDLVTWLTTATVQDVLDVTTDETRQSYIQLLATGGYPELQSMPARLRRRWLTSYVDRVFEKDAPSVAGAVARGRLSTIARLVAANQAGELIKARIGRQAEVSPSTVTSYLDALEDVYLLGRLRAWTPNLTTREVARPKVYITDSALALGLGGVRPQELEPLTSVAIGGYIEGFVAAELRKQQTWSETEFSLFHYRDRSGAEVDIVVELPDRRVIGIEVKSSSTPKGEHFRGLRALQERLGERFVAGVVLCMVSHGYQYATGLYALPVAALWEC